MLPRQNLTAQTASNARLRVSAASLDGRVRVLELMAGSDDNSPASDHVVFRLAVFGHDGQNVAERVLEFTSLRSLISPDDNTPKISN